MWICGRMDKQRDGRTDGQMDVAKVIGGGGFGTMGVLKEKSFYM